MLGVPDLEVYPNRANIPYLFYSSGHELHFDYARGFRVLASFRRIFSCLVNRIVSRARTVHITTTCLRETWQVVASPNGKKTSRPLAKVCLLY
jgi:hypothetical protein